MNYHRRLKHRQKGAVILTVAMALLFLLGFMAIALDFGHMFVVKGELQTSMDACALAAAQELDGAGDAIIRAKSAGKTAGNLNNVNFQSGTWSGKGKIVDADITFKDPFYGGTAVPAIARYAQCQHSQDGIQMWLFQSMGAFAGSADPAYSSTKSVGALAVATRASAQTTCPVPLGLKPKLCGGIPCTAPNYGYQVGEWVTLVGDRTPNSGEIGWYNLDGSTNATELKAELGEPGRCGVRIADTLGTPGFKFGVEPVWNARFGIYKNADPGPSVNHPDYSGYVYTPTNWTNAMPQNAFAGTPAAGSHATAANFKTKRLAFASYDNAGTDIGDGDVITGLTMKGGFKTLATPNAGGEHQQFGYSRRIVAVPVINGATQVIDYACMLILQPLTSPTVDVQLEFVGNAGAANSPCTTNGTPGGAAGPLVPVLVQ